MIWSIIFFACTSGKESQEMAVLEDTAACENPMPAEEYIEFYNWEWCVWAQTCGIPIINNSLEDCSMINEASIAGMVSYDACKARACVDAIRALPDCDEDYWLDAVPECDRVWDVM